MSGVLRYFFRKQAFRSSLNTALRRNIGVSALLLDKAAPVANAMDPVQKLFLDKIRDYKAKAKKLGDGKLVDITPEYENQMNKEIDGLKRRFGEGNLEEFPKFDFEKSK